MTRKRTVSIKVDADRYMAAKAVLKTRGIDLDAWVNLQLLAFSKSAKMILSLSDTMPNGKYQGAKVEDVVRADPAYMSWVLCQDFKVKYDEAVHTLTAELSV